MPVYVECSPTLIILKEKAETGYTVLKSTGGAYTIPGLS